MVQEDAAPVSAQAAQPELLATLSEVQLPHDPFYGRVTKVTAVAAAHKPA